MASMTSRPMRCFLRRIIWPKAAVCARRTVFARWTRRGWGVLAERAIDESTHGGALMRDIQQISREAADDGAEDAPAGDKGDGLRDEEESTSTSVQKVLDVLAA